MSKKLLIISATPRQDGNSDILADEAAQAARAAGAQVEKIKLDGLRIGYCRACDACQGNPQAHCAQKDDMGPLCDKLIAADAVIFASPIYFFTVSGQMKVFLDRTYALGSRGDWTALQGRRAGLIFTYADANPLYSGASNALRMFQDAFMFLGVNCLGCVHASCAAAGEVRGNAAALAQARQLGKQLAEG